MNKANWTVYAVALGLIAATAGWLRELRSRDLLGPPGVRVGAVPIYDEHNKLAATHSVVLPDQVLDMVSHPAPIGDIELAFLPKDTTFGRRIYENWSHDFAAQLSVVLMGTDHTSIHQPQYCLYAQGWTITKTERITVPMARPYADIPAMKITVTKLNNGRMVSGMYVYWFVSGDKITAEEGSRLWSMWKTMLQKGRMERWAYISYFATCFPGQEQFTYQRLARFIQASAPEFQLVKGTPAGGLQPMAAER